MSIRKPVRFIFLISCLFACFYGTAQTATAGSMKPLFNGKNLDGWYSFFNSKGKNNDAYSIFLVENGLLHISGKEFGYISTNGSFKDFHLVAEFKWGTKKWPPCDGGTVKRDNGIVFNIPPGYKDNVWPLSIECQVQEGDAGDIYLLGGATVVVNGKTQSGAYFRIVKKTMVNYQQASGILLR